ncbi:MAG TPA: FAD-dependent monooxygenase [Trebonia sp.]|jgi:2-polyprenyl-6-methoxyphenol hydroxylase-like FAD-dependent oxidoreductase|nr:FAD-dependent monooxygenase [Trebonia sp.]
MRIACAGGGPAGLYFSILVKLRDPECDITVYERSKVNSTSGWGVTFGRSLLAELSRQDRETADRLHAAAFCWRDQVINVRGKQVIAHSEDAYNITRRRLIEILTDRAVNLGVRIEYGTEVLSAAQLPDADLIVAADGVNSKLRNATPGFETKISSGANKYIWLGSDKVFTEFEFLFIETEHGWVWAHAYGIDTKSSTFIVECAERTWTGLGFDVMPIEEALPALEDLFKEHLAGHSLIGELADGNTARWLNFNTISNERWHSGKVVLAGDSAHTAHFAIGMGTTLALQDAICLAGNVRQHADLEFALETYEQVRKAEFRPTVTEAHFSASWFENLDHYIDFSPRKFGVLLFARRSPLVAVLPPSVAYVLRLAAEKFTVLDAARAFVAPAIKAIFKRHTPAHPASARQAGDDGAASLTSSRS